MLGFVFGIIISVVLGGGVAYVLLSKKKDLEAAPSDDPSTAASSFLEETEKITEKSLHLEEAPNVVASEKVALASKQLLREAKNRAKEILLEAKDTSLKIISAAEENAHKIKDQTAVLEKELAIKEAKLESQREDIKNKENSLDKLRESINKKKEATENLYEEQKKKLQQVSSLTREEAREILLKRFDKELTEEKAKKVRLMEKELKETAEEKSQEILLEALTHGSTDYVVEHTTSKVKLADPDMKGRIIGKEGRNITTFEKLSGVEFNCILF